MMRKLIADIGDALRFVDLAVGSLKDGILLVTPEDDLVRLSFLALEHDNVSVAYLTASIDETILGTLEDDTSIDFEDPEAYAGFLAAALRKRPVLKVNGSNIDLVVKPVIDDEPHEARITLKRHANLLPTFLRDLTAHLRPPTNDVQAQAPVPTFLTGGLGGTSKRKRQGKPPTAASRGQRPLV